MSQNFGPPFLVVLQVIFIGLGLRPRVCWRGQILVHLIRSKDGTSSLFVAEKSACKLKPVKLGLDEIGV